MTEIIILSIDSDDFYGATLHPTVGDVGDELEKFCKTYDFNHGLNPIDEIVEWLQDHGVEVNITTAELPGSYVATDPRDTNGTCECHTDQHRFTDGCVGWRDVPTTKEENS